MYAPGPGWAPGGAATGQEWGYIRELRFSSRFLNDVTLCCVLYPSETDQQAQLSEKHNPSQDPASRHGVAGRPVLD